MLSTVLAGADRKNGEARVSLDSLTLNGVKRALHQLKPNLLTGPATII